MEEVFILLFQILEKTVKSDEKRKEIYDEIIPSLYEFDQVLAEKLTDEDDMYAKSFIEFFKTEDDEDESSDW